MRAAFGLLAALSLAAGGCSKPQASGPGADCDKAIDHSMELSKADMQRLEVDAAGVAKMTALGKQHCREDAWSAEAVKCLIDSKTEQQAQICYHNKLTSAQQTKMNAAASAAVPPPPDPSAIASPTAVPPPAGSAATP